MTTTQTLDLTPSPRILQVIAETDLQVYQCLAELIDNCFDELQKARDAGNVGESRVDIRVPNARDADRNSEIVVADTGRGMSPEQMEHALRAGSTNNSQFGTLGLFGMGFNVATARLGLVTEVKSGRVDDEQWNIATIDIGEMQRTGSYRVPLTQEPKAPGEHGTMITVKRLRDDTVVALQTSSEVKKIRMNLGKLYTYMLRDPRRTEFSGSEVVGGLGLSLYLNGTEVKPKLPCIYDPSRGVPYQGDTVRAVQVLDIALSPGWACMNCGYWSTQEPEGCMECASTDVQIRDRRIWGWIGIQRFQDRDDFGINLIRQGRVIVPQDKGLFNWQAPDGTTEVEYPVELRDGRIVGEIHIDHVPVTFRKTDFDRQSPHWTTMVSKVRGDSPLRPKKASSLGLPANETKLAKLFGAYRRVDPGLRYLVPGNGKTAMHEDARVRARMFANGDPEHATDEWWYETARRHDEIVRGVVTKPADDEVDQAEKDWLAEEGLGHLVSDSEKVSGQAVVTEVVAQAPVESKEQRFARYRENASPLPGIEGKVHLGSATTSLRCWLTEWVDLSADGSAHFALRLNSGEVEMFLDRRHPLLKEHGWDPHDVALVCAARSVSEMLRYGGGADEFILEVLETHPDRKLDHNVVRARGDGLLDDIRERMSEVVAEQPGLWSALRPSSKRDAEKEALIASPTIDWAAATESGEFASYLTVGGIRDLVEAHPEVMLDGGVFVTKYAQWDDDDARTDQVERLTVLLGDLGRMARVGKSTTARELTRFGLSAELLAEEIQT
ncbi:MAG: ATP-binding protein [Propionibacteriaceae bacterium]|nr:ATP-binding protein [Propionibacteriaceae bacterium]